MYLTHYDPFFDGMRRLFGATLAGSEDKTQWITPPVDVHEDDQSWTFLLDLPGRSSLNSSTTVIFLGWYSLKYKHRVHNISYFNHRYDVM